MKKLPWGIFAGICAMIAFFAITGTVAAYIILNGVAAQTSETVTLFDNWYQTVLFVLDILSILGFAGCMAMFVLKQKSLKAEEVKDEQFQETV